MAKYKDYPVYTYDEPATYSSFSGGINTDPSNEHLQSSEMRDCLNMHYKSAALVKRTGASLLCTISCEDELYNVQGVFLFTYRLTYIIIAADGKLYQGIYNANTTITLSRLSISVTTEDSTSLYNPSDLTVDLDTYTSEQSNIKHEGFIYEYCKDVDGNTFSIADIYRGEYTDLANSTIEIGEVVSYAGSNYILKAVSSSSVGKSLTLSLYTPGESDYWITLDDYNTLNADAIAAMTDPLYQKYGQTIVDAGLELDINEGKWVISTYVDGDYTREGQDEEAGTIELPGYWEPQTTEWNYLDIVKYYDKDKEKDVIYICDVTHNDYVFLPGTGAQGDFEWSELSTIKELMFQNYRKIEAATYNNKLYITTGTRFVVVELVSNELKASVVAPYICNTEEITNIGYNYLSPYPELCRETEYDQAITSIGGLLAIKNIYGTYTLTPQMNFAEGETEEDYYFKWEKQIGNKWYVVYSYKDNVYTVDGEQKKNNFYTIDVDDADQYKYRVSFAKSFENPISTVDEWSYDTDYYEEGDTVIATDSNGYSKVYKCLIGHTPSTVLWDDVTYVLSGYTLYTYTGYYYTPYKTDAGKYVPLTTPTFSAYTTTRAGYALYKINDDGEYEFCYNDTMTIVPGKTYWEIAYEEEAITRLDTTKDNYDWIVDEVDGEYFGQASSVLATELEPEDTYTIIQSCTKIISDGNKFLLYGDKYNSGSWYKTIIDNPNYITQRGSLSFKTNKNEELIKVVAFNGNLIAFANAENIGGSIHLVSGNGDDYDSDDGYYSPYQRSIINSQISCDNADTVQVCENILVFKYFDTLYYISGSELTNEVVSVYSCNDRIKLESPDVQIPWDDNSCISEVTEDYYALIWKEKYYIEDDDLIQEHPAMKIKMYYKQPFTISDKYYYPWLRDESEYFNVDFIVYIKGKPVYLYNNTLITFNNQVYTDFGKIYNCKVHFRGEDLNYPKMYKLINNVLVYYHRNQYSKLDFDLIVKNEAGHLLLEQACDRDSIQDLRALRTEDTIEDGSTRLDSTILDSKVFNTRYKFPCLLADTVIQSSNDKDFSISSITYNYITIETPETTSYDLYSSIMRRDDTSITTTNLSQLLKGGK